MNSHLVPLSPDPSHTIPKHPPAVPRWARKLLIALHSNPYIFGTQKKAHTYGFKAARWFYTNNSSRPHPTTHQQRYFCDANMWFISDHLRIPLRSLQRKVRALEAYGFLRRLTVASKTGHYAINTWQVAHTPDIRLQFYKKVLRGDVLLPP